MIYSLLQGENSHVMDNVHGVLASASSRFSMMQETNNLKKMFLLKHVSSSSSFQGVDEKTVYFSSVFDLFSRLNSTEHVIWLHLKTVICFCFFTCLRFLS